LGGAVAMVGCFLCFVFGISVLYPVNLRTRTSPRYLVDKTDYDGNTFQEIAKSLILFAGRKSSIR